MTPRDDFIAQLEEYLDSYAGLTPLPNVVRNAVRVQVPRTSQARRLPLPPGFLRMSVPVPAWLVLAGAAAVLIAAAMGIVPRINVGATPSPSPTRQVQSLYRSDQLKLPAGAYLVNHVWNGSAEITLGDGWWTGLENGKGLGLIVRTEGNSAFAAAPNTVLLGFYVVSDVFHDPCRGTEPVTPAPSTVDGVVAALTHEVGFTATPVRDITLDGLPAKTFDMDNSLTPDCPNSPLSQMRYAGLCCVPRTVNNLGYKAHERFWIVDYFGTVLAIVAYANPNAPQTDVAKLYAVVDSLKFP